MIFFLNSAMFIETRGVSNSSFIRNSFSQIFIYEARNSTDESNSADNEKHNLSFTCHFIFSSILSIAELIFYFEFFNYFSHFSEIMSRNYLNFPISYFKVMKSVAYLVWSCFISCPISSCICFLFQYFLFFRTSSSQMTSSASGSASLSSPILPFKPYQLSVGWVSHILISLAALHGITNQAFQVAIILGVRLTEELIMSFALLLRLWITLSLSSSFCVLLNWACASECPPNLCSDPLPLAFLLSFSSSPAKVLLHFIFIVFCCFFAFFCLWRTPAIEWADLMLVFFLPLTFSSNSLDPLWSSWFERDVYRPIACFLVD